MGTFIFVGFLGLVVGAFVGLGWYIEQQKKPVEIALDEVPAMVRDEAERRVVGLAIERVLKRPVSSTYRFYGQASGQPIRIKVRLGSASSQSYIDKVEIQPETRSAYRSLKGKHLIDLSQVPDVVIQHAQQAAKSYRAELEEISKVKAATVQDRNAYDIKGWSGDWRVELELLDDGEVLEVELEYRPGRQQSVA